MSWTQAHFVFGPGPTHVYLERKKGMLARLAYANFFKEIRPCLGL
jgi:hypothetical protein